jgi:hypothetical protein
VTNGKKGERKPTQRFTTADLEACHTCKRKHIGDKELPEPAHETAVSEPELSSVEATTRTTVIGICGMHDVQTRGIGFHLVQRSVWCPSW